LLDQAGLAAEVLEIGRRIDTVAFYEGASRRAEIKFSQLTSEFTFLLVLSQRALEDILDRRLLQAGVHVRWHHRLSDLKRGGDTVATTIDELAETSKGYIVAEWDTVVKRTFRTEARYVIGADGRNSLVRRCLGAEFEAASPPQWFALYEIESGAPVGSEMRVVLDDSTTNVMWPLADNRCRWAFQWTTPEGAEPSSEQRAAMLLDPSGAQEETHGHLRRFLSERAPWFEGGVKDVNWASEIESAPGVVSRFGEGHCWLAGDAAHQSGLAGVQSMNVGMCEAFELAEKLEGVLRDKAPLNSLESYGTQRRQEWLQLLGMRGELVPTEAAQPWVRKRAGQILSCIAASGDDLRQLVRQLGLELSD
jgi:2-polyprenyl-6-methoxyphenol hydroxylase-like FAD-dependent oxidoreductase